MFSKDAVFNVPPIEYESTKIQPYMISDPPESNETLKKTLSHPESIKNSFSNPSGWQILSDFILSSNTHKENYIKNWRQIYSKINNTGKIIS
jgi:hypothetical protein